jgi:hypothetical protein
MTCVHKVKMSVRRPEKCNFNLSVSHYKDRIVAPAEYTGATAVTPSDQTQILETKDKLVRDDITINPAPAPDLRPLTIDSLTQSNATFTPDGFDGYSGATIGEEWDGVLLRPEDGLNFYTKWVDLNPGETLVIDGVGAGSRWFAVNSRKPAVVTFGRNFGSGSYTDTSYRHLRVYVETLESTTVFLAGYEWQTEEGIRREDSYGFRGEYLKWKVIPAT